MATDAKDKKEIEECTIVVEELNNPETTNEIVGASGLLLDLAKIVVGYGSNGCAILARLCNAHTLLLVNAAQLRWGLLFFRSASSSLPRPTSEPYFGYTTERNGSWRLCHCFSSARGYEECTIGVRSVKSCSGRTVYCLGCASRLSFPLNSGWVVVPRGSIAWTDHAQNE